MGLMSAKHFVDVQIVKVPWIKKEGNEIKIKRRYLEYIYIERERERS